MSDSQNNLIQHITDFIEVKTERLKLKLISKTAGFLSTALSISMFIGIAFFMIFFLSFGGALWINAALENSYIGFFFLGGFYLLLIILILILFKRKTIQNLFESLLIKLMEPSEDESED